MDYTSLCDEADNYCIFIWLIFITSLQVDCFSFAMFMYELLSLQRPFEGVIGKDVGRLSEVIKQLIKDGQRPLLNKKVGVFLNRSGSIGDSASF